MASTYDIWKTTDPTWESCDDRAPCAFWYKIDKEEFSQPHFFFCNVFYEDHNDEELGHAFVMPEASDGPDC
jgi:hypothetical protein